MDLRLLFPVLIFLFLTACQSEPTKEYDFNALLDAYGDERITGEWISYSDIEWAAGLGYQLSPPEG